MLVGGAQVLPCARDPDSSANFRIHQPRKGAPTGTRRDGGSVAEETMHSGLDAVEYETDLSSKNTAALRQVFDKWSVPARRIGRISRA
ncbi:Lsr2 dimerization domain-containing protein [Nocardia carnea]|uniref:Lsr2 dimerization domain-containing protein n=1 Tax=Nocardia carnea TaxID=37328 RepID=UPI003D7C1152